MKGKPPKPATLDDVLAAVKDLPAQVAKILTPAAPVPSAPAPVTQPIYAVPPSAQATAAGFTGANTLPPKSYDSDPSPTPDGPDFSHLAAIPKPNVVRLGRLLFTGGKARDNPSIDVVAGRPAFFDFGNRLGYPDPKSPNGLPLLTDPAVIAEYATNVAILQQAAPGVPVGMVDTPCTIVADSATPDQLKAGLAPFRRLIEQCDFVSHAMYPGQRQYFDRDLAATERTALALKAEFKKPLYFWIKPDFADGTPLTPDEASRLMALARRFDAVVVWAVDAGLAVRVFGPVAANK